MTNAAPPSPATSRRHIRSADVDEEGAMPPALESVRPDCVKSPPIAHRGAGITPAH
jgi:hypothetical protein